MWEQGETATACPIPAGRTNGESQQTDLGEVEPPPSVPMRVVS
jgi:hypothetical protein